MPDTNTDTQRFTQEYRDLDAASAAVFKTIIELAVILLAKQQETEQDEKSA